MSEGHESKAKVLALLVARRVPGVHPPTLARILQERSITTLSEAIAAADEARQTRAGNDRS